MSPNLASFIQTPRLDLHRLQFGQAELFLPLLRRNLEEMQATLALPSVIETEWERRKSLTPPMEGCVDLGLCQHWLKTCVRDWESSASFEWGVFRRRELVPLGCVAVRYVRRIADSPYWRGMLSYWLDAPHRRQGLASEAVGGVMREMRSANFGLLSAYVLARNIASVKLLRRIGLIYDSAYHNEEHPTLGRYWTDLEDAALGGWVAGQTV